MANIMDAEIPNSCSWIFRGILNCRHLTHQNSTWDSMLRLPKFHTGLIYRGLHNSGNTLPWRTVFYRNPARPRAHIIVWLACLERLNTRARLHRFGFIQDMCCCFCLADETQHHLLFECPTTFGIWMTVLAWLRISHTPQAWTSEITWLLRCTRGKGWRAKLLKLAFTEAVYELWMFRNMICF